MTKMKKMKKMKKTKKMEKTNKKMVLIMMKIRPATNRALRVL